MTIQSTTTLTAALSDSASDRRLEVLRLVGQSGSISEAARQVGISYKAAWQAIDTLTNLSGVALVDRTVGGSGGGGARITAQGLALLALADELANARQQVLARFAGGAALVGSLGLRTSMRNQLPCTVLRCEALAPQDPMATVTLQTPGGALLQSSITWESADLLGLVSGLAVLVLCKATAVQVLAVTAEVKAEVTAGVAAAELADITTALTTALAHTSKAAAQAVPSACQLVGRVVRVTPGQGRDEVVLALDGGGHWVGFATHPFVAALGQSAVARMGTSSLVVGLAG